MTPGWMRRACRRRRRSGLLRPWEGEGLTAWPVSTRVNNVRNNDAALTEVAAI